MCPQLTEMSRWRNLLALVQKTHFKSSNMQKLSLSLAVYRGLLEIPLIRADVLSKVSSMLLHPFPKVSSTFPFQLIASGS